MASTKQSIVSPGSQTYLGTPPLLIDWLALRCLGRHCLGTNKQTTGQDKKNRQGLFVKNIWFGALCFMFHASIVFLFFWNCLPYSSLTAYYYCYYYHGIWRDY